MFVITQLQKEVQVLGEQHVVMLKWNSEQRERLGERPTPHDHFGPSLREQVERGELLEKAYWICRTEHRHRAREANPPRFEGGGREDHRRCGIEEFHAVVLTHAKDVETDLVSKRDSVHQQAKLVRGSEGATVVIRG